MTEVAHPIDLNLPAKLRDREYRQGFFLAESSAQIAAQLIALRKRRDLNQQQVAELIDTQQPAISRIEKADYQSWSFSVLRKIADALDARIRVLIEPSEDILAEYEGEPQAAGSSEYTFDVAAAVPLLPGLPIQSNVFIDNLLAPLSLQGVTFNYTPNFDVLCQTQVAVAPDPQIKQLKAQLAFKDTEIAERDEKIRQLQLALMNVPLSTNRVPNVGIAAEISVYSAGQMQPQLRAL